MECLLCIVATIVFCTNPFHLSIGTTQDNTADRVSKGRNYHPLGIKNVFAKLTEKDIPYILNSSKTSKELAKELGVIGKSIRNVRNRKTWKHISASE